VKGSHIVVPRLHDGDYAFILQQPDRRVVFAIPYEGKFTLIGTTDVPFEGDAMKPVISAEETQYLCDAVNRFFEMQIAPEDVVWAYSGVRALTDDGSAKAQQVTRDYRLDLDSSRAAPILSVFGGKLTTYRMLSKHSVDKITGHKKNAGWTAKSPLPGGDFAKGGLDGFLAQQRAKYKFLPEELLHRYAHAYGTRMDVLLEKTDSMKSLGRDFGSGLYEIEIKYLIDHEFAKTAEDILWRRTKIGLHAEKRTALALESAMPDYLQERKIAS